MIIIMVYVLGTVFASVSIRLAWLSEEEVMQSACRKDAMAVARHACEV